MNLVSRFALAEAYLAGVETGDIDNAYRAWASLSVHGYIGGTSLDLVEESGEVSKDIVKGCGVLKDVFL